MINRITEMFGIATHITTPIMLAALIVIVFYLIWRQVLRLKIFSKISSEATAKIIGRIINLLALIAVITIILACLSTFIPPKIPHTNPETQSSIKEGYPQSQIIVLQNPEIQPPLSEDNLEIEKEIDMLIVSYNKWETETKANYRKAKEGLKLAEDAETKALVLDGYRSEVNIRKSQMVSNSLYQAIAYSMAAAIYYVVSSGDTNYRSDAEHCAELTISSAEAGLVYAQKIRQVADSTKAIDSTKVTEWQKAEEWLAGSSIPPENKLKWQRTKGLCTRFLLDSTHVRRSEIRVAIKVLKELYPENTTPEYDRLSNDIIMSKVLNLLDGSYVQETIKSTIQPSSLGGAR